jgi:hypothetical protein
MQWCLLLFCDFSSAAAGNWLLYSTAMERADKRETGFAIAKQ